MIVIDTIVISPLLYKENILIFQIVLNVFQLRFATPIEMKQQPLFLVMLLQKETEVIKTKLNVRCPNCNYIVLLGSNSYIQGLISKCKKWPMFLNSIHSILNM